jgi:hypothetical protein
VLAVPDVPLLPLPLPLLVVSLPLPLPPVPSPPPEHAATEATPRVKSGRRRAARVGRKGDMIARLCRSMPCTQ